MKPNLAEEIRAAGPLFTSHPERDLVLGEVHARPFHAVAGPARLLHFAFMTDGPQAAADRAALATWCTARGRPAPLAGAKHHRVEWHDGSLRWEQHSEFTTYTWQFAAETGSPFVPRAGALAEDMRRLPQPGPHLVSVDLHYMPETPETDASKPFDPSSLAMASVNRGGAMAATDYRADADGFVRVLVLDRSLTPPRAGALLQRLLEIETYRILALLGLPQTQRVAPSVKRIEDELTRIADAMKDNDGLAEDRALLDDLTGLAAALEADVAASSYRFGATRAYDGIVRQRLAAIDEEPVEGWPPFSSFLERRMAPALRTCAMLEERQTNLSTKLARAANLLRTRVDVEIERQNRDLLASMNERTRLQLRLQQTVEGLSVAAISYYIVGLAAYLFKGAKDARLLPFDPGLATAAAVPLSILLVALVVRRTRKGHKAEDAAAQEAAAREASAPPSKPRP